MPLPLDNFLAFTLAVLLMNLSPGPSFFYLLARSVAQGQRAGLAAVAGQASGSLLHAIAAVLGLSTIFVYSPTSFSVLKIGGGLYLLYLGGGHLLATTAYAETSLPPSDKRPLQVYWESVVVEVTNPKTVLFFVALLPQFVDYETGRVALQLAVLGLIGTLAAVPIDLLVCFSASRAADWLNRNGKARLLLDRMAGSILVGLGGYVLLAEFF